MCKVCNELATGSIDTVHVVARSCIEETHYSVIETDAGDASLSTRSGSQQRYALPFANLLSNNGKIEDKPLIRTMQCMIHDSIRIKCGARGLESSSAVVINTLEYMLEIPGSCIKVLGLTSVSIRIYNV